MGRVREERKRKEDQRRERQKKDDQGMRKGRKVAKHCVLPTFCGPRGSKSRLAKAAGAEPSEQMKDQQLQAVVARSSFRSQNLKSTSCSEHIGTLRCEADLKVKMSKSPHVRCTFGS